MATSLRINKEGLLYRLKSLINLQRLTHTFAEGKLEARNSTSMGPDSKAYRVGNGLGLVDISKWKKVDSRTLGITRSMISLHSWTVLRKLHDEGFEAYLVGGCVRDLLLNRIPKDFDVITTANLKQIKKVFKHALIIGRRFPICMVRLKKSVIEVSSFETVAGNDKEKKDILYSQMPKCCDKRDLIRWKNSLLRDFTINSLFFDPFVHKIYDYTNGLEDLRALKLRTLVPAQISFKEDCARILRGLRIAARLGLSLSRDTENAIHSLSSSIKDLDKFRLLLEMKYMFSYGAAEPSLSLLWKFKLLKILLPFHAAYLDRQTSQRCAESSTMLMKLFNNFDKLIACDQPSDCSLWVALLVFHQALINNPQDALVIRAFGSVLYHGEWEQGVKFARKHAEVHVEFEPEISSSSQYMSDEELAKGVTQLACLVLDCIDTPTGTEIISARQRRVVAKIFEALRKDIESYWEKRESFEIDYHMLGHGQLSETRFVLGKVILETIGGRTIRETEVVEKERYELQPESIEEKGPVSLLEVFPAQLKARNDKRHVSHMSTPEIRRSKKQKLDRRESALPLQETSSAIRQQNEKKVHKGTAQKCQKLVDLPKGDACTLQKIPSKKKCLQQEEITNKEQDAANTGNYEGCATRQGPIATGLTSLDWDNTKADAITRLKTVKHDKVSGVSPQKTVREKNRHSLVSNKQSWASLSGLFK